MRDDFSVGGVSPDSLVVSWKPDILKEKGIKRLFLGITSLDIEGKHRKLSSYVESENMTIKMLSPATKYRLTMRENRATNTPISLEIGQTWPLGITYLIINFLMNCC